MRLTISVRTDKDNRILLRAKDQIAELVSHCCSAGARGDVSVSSTKVVAENVLSTWNSLSLRNEDMD